MLTSFTELGQWYHSLCNGLATVVKKKEKQGCLADFGLRTTYVVHGYFLKIPVSTFTMWIYRRWHFSKRPTPSPEKLQKFRKGERWTLPPPSSCVIWLAHPLRQQKLPSPWCWFQGFFEVLCCFRNCYRVWTQLRTWNQLQFGKPHRLELIFVLC